MPPKTLYEAKEDALKMADKYGAKNFEETMIYLSQACDQRGKRVQIPATLALVKTILEAVHGPYLPTVMAQADTPEWSRQRIEAAADFAFMGEPRAYMELDLGGRIGRVTYVVHGYIGRDEHLLVRHLTQNLCDAITSLDGRHCVIWRRYPQLEEVTPEDNERPYTRFAMRLAVVNENWEQVRIDQAVVVEGTSPEIL